MNLLKNVTSLALFIIIGVVAIIDAIYYDDYLLISDKQVFVKDLNNNQEKITKLADKNNVIIYSVNYFSYQHDQEGISHIILESDIYASTDYNNSTFYLNGAKNGSYDTFQNYREARLHNLTELKSQDIVDLWVVYQNIDNYNNFVHDLKQAKIDFSNIDVNPNMVGFDYKSEYQIAVGMFILLAIIINVVLMLKSVKEISLKLIYQDKKKLFKIIINNFIKNIIICLTVFIAIITLVYLYNGLRRFDIVYQSYIPTSFLAIIILFIADLISLIIVIRKVDLVKALQNFISNLFIYRAMNVAIIFSLILSAHFIYLTLGNLTFLSPKPVNSKYIDDNNLIFGKDSAKLRYRYLALNSDESSGEYNEKNDRLAYLLQTKFDAVVLYFDDLGNLYVNANYFKYKDIFDKNGNKIMPVDINRTIELNNEVEHFDFNYDVYKTRSTKTINQIKFSEFYMTGGIDMVFNYQENEKSIRKMINKEGLNDIVGAIINVNFEVYDKQLGAVLVEISKQGLNFIFFFVIFLFTLYLNFLTYVEINKKKLGLKLVYRQNIFRRYLDLLVLIAVDAIAGLILANIIYGGEYSLKLIIPVVILSIIFILFYARKLEINNLKKWLNGG